MKVSVVRCKECVHDGQCFVQHQVCADGNWFCANGEKKEQDETQMEGQMSLEEYLEES